MSNSIPIIEARGLHRFFHDATRELHILQGIDLRVMPGESLAIIGVSGSGKSTLLHLLAGLDRPSQGEVFLNGEEYSSLSETEISRRRSRDIGIIYQFHHLMPEFTALENVMLPGMIARRPMDEIRTSAEARLAEVGLKDRFNHRPTKLSGGEQQRVALARALMNDPLLVLADEPTGSLDTDSAQEAIDLLWNATTRKGKALVIVTHEPTIALRADRILRLEGGRFHDQTAELKTKA